MNRPAEVFRDLIVWQKAHEFVLQTYKQTEQFPRHERYWHVSLLDRGYSPVQASDPNITCSDLEPEISITATPVIDRSAGPNGRIFVVVMETDGKQNYNYKLHALDLATGKDALTPVVIAASITGQGPATTFKATRERSRSGLLLWNGIIYTAGAGFCDNPPFTGWILGYR